MVRVIVALAIAASKTSTFVRAMGEYVITTDGCGQSCEPIDISTLTVQGVTYNARECLEVGGDYSGFYIDVPAVFQCTKVAVKNGGKIARIDASSRVPLCLPHETM